MSTELDEIRVHLVRIEELLTTPRVQPLTVSTADAMIMTGHNSDSAFHRWAKQNKLRSCGFGLYLTEQVKLALYRGATARANPSKPISPRPATVCSSS